MRGESGIDFRTQCVIMTLPGGEGGGVIVKAKGYC